jgi:hypothetical protein
MLNSTLAQGTIQGVLLNPINEQALHNMYADDVKTQHTFLAAQLDRHNQIPGKLWRLLCSISAWLIWKAKCDHFMEDRRTPSQEIIRRIWRRLGIYIQKMWQEHVDSIRSGQKSQEQALEQMHLDFGSHRALWQ